LARDLDRTFWAPARPAPLRKEQALATDWATVSSLATAGGTLALAVATFASVRSANRAARVAEQSLMEGLRPLPLSRGTRY